MSFTIENREYIQDVISSPTIGLFQNQSLSVNPGLQSTFPWLATIAQNFDQYYIHGIEFFYRSVAGDNTTTGAQGTVIMAQETNVNQTAYTSKQQMENSDNARSFKQATSGGMLLRRKDALFFIRQGAIPVGDSLKFYDHSIFQIATQGFPAASFNCGELWVKYRVTFGRPQIPGILVQSDNYGIIKRSNCTAVLDAYYGLSTTFTGGNIQFSFPVVGTVRIANLIPGQAYEIRHHWSGTTAAVTAMNFLLTNPALPGGKNLYNGLPVFTGGLGNSSTSVANISFTATAATQDLTLSVGVIPTASNLQLMVNVVGNAITI